MDAKAVRAFISMSRIKNNGAQNQIYDNFVDIIGDSSWKK